MRHILLSFVLVLVILPLAARQDGEDFMQSVHEAIEKGDAEKLVIYFHDPVDLKIDKKKGMYSVDQAEMMLNIFLIPILPQPLHWKRMPIAARKNPTASKGMFRAPTNIISIFGKAGRRRVLYHSILYRKRP